MLTVRWDDIPSLELLEVGRESTDEEKLRFPRDGLTVWNGYCIQPAALMDCSGQFEGEDLNHMQSTDEISMTICKDCHSTLSKGRIPDTSLVAFDTGTRVLLQRTAVVNLRDFFTRCYPGRTRPPYVCRGKLAQYVSGATTALLH